MAKTRDTINSDTEARMGMMPFYAKFRDMAFREMNMPGAIGPTSRMAAGSSTFATRGRRGKSSLSQTRRVSCWSLSLHIQLKNKVMKQPYLEVTFRKGRPLAAYYY